MIKVRRFDKDFSRSEDLIEGIILDNCEIKMSDVTYSEISEEIFAKITLIKNSNTSFKIKKHKSFKIIKVGIDSSEFEKIYDVFTDDKISTSRILTSDLIHILIDSISEYIALSNTNLYIRIFFNKDIFEPKGDLLDKSHIEETYNMINIVFEFIETLTKNILEKCEN